MIDCDPSITTPYHSAPCNDLVPFTRDDLICLLRASFDRRAPGAPCRVKRSMAVSADSEAHAVARLQAQPWIRPGNGEKVRGAGRPASVPEGTAEEFVHWVRGE